MSDDAGVDAEVFAVATELADEAGTTVDDSGAG